MEDSVIKEILQLIGVILYVQVVVVIMFMQLQLYYMAQAIVLHIIVVIVDVVGRYRYENTYGFTCK